MDLPPPPRPARRICRGMVSYVHYTWIPIGGAAVLALHSCRQLVLAFSISDFGMRSCGYWRATFVRSAFTGLIDGCLMASVEQTWCGVSRSTKSATSVRLRQPNAFSHVVQAVDSPEPTP